MGAMGQRATCMGKFKKHLKAISELQNGTGMAAIVEEFGKSPNFSGLESTQVGRGTCDYFWEIKGQIT